MNMTRTLAITALTTVLAGATAFAAVPASAAPMPSTLASTSKTAGVTSSSQPAAPQIGVLLLPLNGLGVPEVLGQKAQPGATVEVTYNGVTVSTTARDDGEASGFWNVELPSGAFAKDQNQITAVQVVDGQRSKSSSYTIDEKYLPHF